MNALIIVDVQNDFLPGGALAVPRGDQVIPVANRVSPTIELVLATQDWHPPEHGSFAANHPGRKPGDVIDLGGLEQILWPVHCVQNTPGAAFAADLDLGRVARVFRKGVDPDIDSYSTFFDNARRRSTGLADYLRERGVRDVYLLGLATDYCVKFSALDAIELGFNTFVIEDGCRAIDLQPGDAACALAEIKAKGGTIVCSTDLVGT
jgi:nicotinamidase/pyrazinamidase